MKKYLLPVFFLGLIVSCKEKEDNDEKEIAKAKEEIANAERDFQKMTADKGIAEAFWFFADSNATIKRRNDSLIHGKDAIRNFYNDKFYTTATVTWAPDFVEASEDGDLGYTYGKYHWLAKDSSGNPIEFKGIFHTVWKKQKDGSWKYTWD